MSSDFDEIWYVCLYDQYDTQNKFLGPRVNWLTRYGSNKTGRFSGQGSTRIIVLLNNLFIY